MLRLKKIVYSYLVFDSAQTDNAFCLRLTARAVRRSDRHYCLVYDLAQTDIGFNGQVLRPTKLIRI